MEYPPLHLIFSSYLFFFFSSSFFFFLFLFFSFFFTSFFFFLFFFFLFFFSLRPLMRRKKDFVSKQEINTCMKLNEDNLIVTIIISIPTHTEKFCFTFVIYRLRKCTRCARTINLRILYKFETYISSLLLREKNQIFRFRLMKMFERNEKSKKQEVKQKKKSRKEYRKKVAFSILSTWTWT